MPVNEGEMLKWIIQLCRKKNIVRANKVVTTAALFEFTVATRFGAPYTIQQTEGVIYNVVSENSFY